MLGFAPVAFATFNLGVELGQILFVITVILIWQLVRPVLTGKNWLYKSVPYAIGSISMFWLIDRMVSMVL
jgi:hypothetical protein